MLFFLLWLFWFIVLLRICVFVSLLRMFSIFVSLLRLLSIFLNLLLLLSIPILSRFHHATQQLDALARLVTVILHFTLLRLWINQLAHSHFATAIATGTATTSTVTALHDLAFWKIRLRNLSLIEHDKTYSTDAH